MIISASRRTDIPAFYSRWLMNRLDAGVVFTRNPFNAKQVNEISLRQEDVDVIVFWTRNAKPLIKYLPELNQRGYRYIFQYTITGYPRQLETALPSLNQSIDTFCQISELIGAERVIWRYDPILLTQALSVTDHLNNFSTIARQLRGKTKRVMISFADLYQKTTRNLDKLANVNYQDITKAPELCYQLVSQMAAIATDVGLSMQTCAEELDFSDYGVLKGKCIDDQLLNRLFSTQHASKKDRGQRLACHCISSVDIGSYNSCLHGCQYCYATYSQVTVQKNRQLHNPNSPFLLG